MEDPDHGKGKEVVHEEEEEQHVEEAHVEPEVPVDPTMVDREFLANNYYNCVMAWLEENATPYDTKDGHYVLLTHVPEPGNEDPISAFKWGVWMHPDPAPTPDLIIGKLKKAKVLNWNYAYVLRMSQRNVDYFVFLLEKSGLISAEKERQFFEEWVASNLKKQHPHDFEDFDLEQWRLLHSKNF